ncbi:MAG: aspartate aminotransferase-like enzyme [Flavobacterium sp.]|jgi:aspartate aminotransferase-like enzyme
MSGLLPSVDPEGLLEYSVVFTDRSLNHMSQSFRDVMQDISHTLKEVYQSDAVALVPGSGTFGMEAVARQFATGKKCLVIRNGFFSYRWTQIFEMGNIPESHLVLKAKQLSDETQSAFEPPKIEDVVATILREKPDLVFAPHVETSSGIMLSEQYMTAVADAVHQVDGLFVLDCIASGTVWVDMKKTGIDVLISAPQKGWSASPCCALVMFSQDALNKMKDTISSSFACDLAKWLSIMQAYENGGHAYHATMPTDSIIRFRDTMLETQAYGFDKVKDEQLALGRAVRDMIKNKGIQSVATDEFAAPGVVVSFTSDVGIQSGAKFVELGLQIAAGVPLMCDERDDYQTFRLGLFGLDKLHNLERTVTKLSDTIDKLL